MLPEKPVPSWWHELVPIVPDTYTQAAKFISYSINITKDTHKIYQTLLNLNHLHNNKPHIKSQNTDVMTLM